MRESYDQAGAESTLHLARAPRHRAAVSSSALRTRCEKVDSE